MRLLTALAFLATMVAALPTDVEQGDSHLEVLSNHQCQGHLCPTKLRADMTNAEKKNLCPGLSS